jgi:HAD superfamily hydrolase (TIGR01509 family)
MTAILAAEAPRVDQVKSLVVRARALIFDVDGTLAETEELHRQAFNEAFARTGLDWRWEREVYKELLRVAGGKERIRAFDCMRQGPPVLSEPEIAELHRVKTARYAELIAEGKWVLRPGVKALLAAARLRGQRLAIATTTSRSNIDALLSVALAKDWTELFAAVVAGDDVPRKKPAPDVYIEVLERLKLAASDCVAIEDSGNGLAAASLAGVPVLITRSLYFPDDDFSSALLAVDDLSEILDTDPGTGLHSPSTLA